LVVVFSLIRVAATVSAQENTVTFDNQSGEAALVKLVGPSHKVVQVPTGAKRTVTATAGEYHIKARYGTPGRYRYARGDNFRITETATQRSQISITLHKVIGGNYGTRAISEKEFGDTTTPLAQKAETAADHVGAVSFVVPDGWDERSGQKWSKCAQKVQDVSPLGKALRYTEGQQIGHTYWENEKKEFQGVYFELKDGSPGIQFVPWVNMFMPGLGEPKFPPNLDREYYTFRGTVYSARQITFEGKRWPVMSKILSVGDKFMRTEETQVSGRRCLRADPIAREVFPLGKSLGYTEGERVGPPYWAEWQPKDECAKNPVAPYASESEAQSSRTLVSDTKTARVGPWQFSILSFTTEESVEYKMGNQVKTVASTGNDRVAAIRIRCKRTRDFNKIEEKEISDWQGGLLAEAARNMFGPALFLTSKSFFLLHLEPVVVDGEEKVVASQCRNLIAEKGLVRVTDRSGKVSVWVCEDDIAEATALFLYDVNDRNPWLLFSPIPGGSQCAVAHIQITPGGKPSFEYGDLRLMREQISEEFRSSGNWSDLSIVEAEFE